MAELKVKVEITDWPEFKEKIARIKRLCGGVHG